MVWNAFNVLSFMNTFCPQWTLKIPELERSLNEARGQGINVRALAVINPGNPTGQCLDPSGISEIVKFAERECVLWNFSRVDVNTFDSSNYSHRASSPQKPCADG